MFIRQTYKNIIIIINRVIVAVRYIMGGVVIRKASWRR